MYTECSTPRHFLSFSVIVFSAWVTVRWDRTITTAPVKGCRCGPAGHAAFAWYPPAGTRQHEVWSCCSARTTKDHCRGFVDTVGPASYSSPPIGFGAGCSCSFSLLRLTTRWVTTPVHHHAWRFSAPRERKGSVVLRRWPLFGTTSISDLRPDI